MWSWISLFIVLYRVCHVYTASKPHIIFILADDLGFNDVGFHGCNEIRTPNIDVLAYTGLILHNYYVTPICTPSRSAIMTGKYPIHNGMQHMVIYGAEPRGLPLEEKILPQYLKDLGYKTHLVGKWHLGSYKKEYLPLNRGFDSHLGFWTGKIDMYDHTNMEKGTWGYDFRRGFKIADDLFGQYATDVYTKEAVKLIKYHNKSEPMFLMVSHSAMHSGNPNEPLRAPDKLIANFSDIQDFQRRKYAAMLVNMDESVGKVVQALRTRGMLENSVIVFTTDNGGAAAGFNDNAASNYPLRGVKNTLWEGGVRGAGLLWSSKLAGRARVATQKFHLVDWLPTLYRLAGGDVSVLKNLDGMDLWEHLYENLESNRTSVLHNIDNFDDVWNSAALTIGQWKIVAGTNYLGAWDGWYGPSCRNGSYKYEFLYKSDAAAAINTITRLPDKDQIKSIREAATIYCNKSIPVVPCKPLVTPCLYNIDADPCERENLADSFPTVVQAMLTELQSVNRTAVPPNNEPLDPIGDPKYWGRVFTNFGDYKVLPLKPT